MGEPTVDLVIVNHVAVDIAAPPDRVWRAIVAHYVDGVKFTEQGYWLEPLDSAEAPLGGFRMGLGADADEPDDRFFRITERDDAAHRLSVYADYTSRLAGIEHVYATYHAQPGERGTRYALDCHGRLKVARPDDGDVGAVIAALTAQFEADLVEYLAGFRDEVEADGRAD